MFVCVCVIELRWVGVLFFVVYTFAMWFMYFVMVCVGLCYCVLCDSCARDLRTHCLCVSVYSLCVFACDCVRACGSFTLLLFLYVCACLCDRER